MSITPNHQMKTWRKQRRILANQYLINMYNKKNNHDTSNKNSVEINEKNSSKSEFKDVKKQLFQNNRNSIVHPLEGDIEKKDLNN